MPKHIVCIASEHKGNEFLDEAHYAGWDVTLVTRKKLLNEPWQWTALTDVRTVEDNASIGSGATILCGVRIGSHAVVGAGAVVTADVERDQTVAGVPARTVRR